MKLTTSRFGTVEFQDERVLTFPAGIIGFPRSTRYVILDHHRDVPFKWLQSVDEPALAFVIMDPVLFKPDYCAEVAAEEAAELAAADESDLVMFVILTIPSGDPSRITANLRGPLLVNPRTRCAKQVVLEQELPTRYPVFSGDPAPSVPQREPAPLAGCR
jgi:flagellar assembly factor FliW